MKFTVFLFAAAFFVLPSAISAQEASGADQPPVPRLGQAPATSAWTIKYQYKKPDPFPQTSNPLEAQLYEKMRKAYPRLTTIVVTKAGDRRKRLEDYADGTGSLTWFVGDYIVMIQRASHLISVGTIKQTDFNFREDFYELDWINKAQYQGRQDFQGVTCCVYQMPDPDTSGSKTAYIDAKSSLPVAVETNDAIQSYSFTSSSDSLDVPKDIARQIKAYQASLAPKTY